MYVKRVSNSYSYKSNFKLASDTFIQARQRENLYIIITILTLFHPNIFSKVNYYNVRSPVLYCNSILSTEYAG